MVASPPIGTQHYSPEDYRQREAKAQTRHEYRSGEIIEIPGSSVNHNSLTLDLAFTLQLLLQDTEFKIFSSDLRVWMPACQFGAYPDVMAIDGEPILNGDRTDEILNPRFIAEVLSPATADYDRGTKFSSYRNIDSFREYLLISQTEPLVEHYWKTEDGVWHLEDLRGLEATIALRHLPATFALKQVYRRVKFD